MLHLLQFAVHVRRLPDLALAFDSGQRCESTDAPKSMLQIAGGAGGWVCVLDVHPLLLWWRVGNGIDAKCRDGRSLQKK